MSTKVCIIGAGPAGLMAAIFTAKAGAETLVIERNTVAGRKLLLTGGGRCNLTHTGGVQDLVRDYGRYGRFLRHCLYEFPPDEVRKFFADAGLETKEFPDGCVFPASEQAGDVRDALVAEAKKSGARILFDGSVIAVEKSGDEFLIRTAGETISAKKIIIATGGASYPQTGSRGDGYEFARRLGHTIILPRPALVPLVAGEKWLTELAGTSLDNVKISATVGGKKVIATGPMLFTQDGIGGPAAQDLSRYLTDYLSAISSADGGPAEKPIEIAIDVIPAMNESGLDEYLIGKASQHSRKIIINILFDLIPKGLAGLLCRQVHVSYTIGSQLKKEQRRRIVQLLKKLPLSITAARPIDEATVTRGGVSTNEIAPKTMQSKICPGLFLAGEVIDADGPCGGYNLQIAFSTAALAGKSSSIQC